jgi:hypothetical protein
MESVEHDRVDQVGWPDHRRGPHQEASDETSHTETNHLAGDDQEHLETPSEVLAIEDFLREQDIGRVRHATGKGGVGHDDNDRVLLHVEGAGVETPSVAESCEMSAGHDYVPALAQWIGDQLDDIGGDGNGGVSQRKEQVDGGSNGGERQTDDPGAHRVARHINFIVVSDSGSHFGVGRVLFEESVFDCDFLLDIARVEGRIDGVELVLGQIQILRR